MPDQEEKILHHGSQVPPVCAVCAREPECLHWNLSTGESERVSAIVDKPPKLGTGQHLFRVGERIESVYAVRSGAFKMYAIEGDGSECVVGFSLPGELLGFDGVYAQRRGCSAVALVDSAVCRLPYTDLAALMRSIARLREQVLRLASRDYGAYLLTDGSNTEVDLARFLIDFNQRSREASDSVLELPMTRPDLASYLRVSPAALDQAFAGFGDRGLIEMDGDLLTLLEPAELRRIAASP